MAGKFNKRSEDFMARWIFATVKMINFYFYIFVSHSSKIDLWFSRNVGTHAHTQYPKRCHLQAQGHKYTDYFRRLLISQQFKIKLVVYSI